MRRKFLSLFALMPAFLLKGQQQITTAQIKNLPPPVQPQPILINTFRGILLNTSQSPNTWTMANTFAIPNAVNPDGLFLVFYNGVYQNEGSYAVAYNSGTNLWSFVFKTQFTSDDNAEVRYTASSTQ